jgi:diguanylate cyclase (GGDEF)-like protein
MDRGGRTTLLLALIPFGAAGWAVTRGVPDSIEPVVTLLPELLVAPVAVLSLRFGCHRPLVAGLLLIAIHRVPVPDGATSMAAVAVALNMIVLAAVPNARVDRLPGLVHVLVGAASIPVVAVWGAELVRRPIAAAATGPTWELGSMGVAGLATLAGLAWRRGPVDAALPWVTGAVAVVLLAPPASPGGSLVLAAAQATLALALVEEGHRLAFHDRLTGLPNRRAFDERMRRLRGRFALAMVDVDRFKAFNDRWGHDAGDQVLRMVATEIAKVGGGADAYRYGGEEFAVVFPDHAVRHAVEHLETVRTAIADRGFYIRSGAPSRKRSKRKRRRGTPQRVQVTVSAGIATAEIQRTDPAAVLRAADRALYRAKRNGRNRVAST